MKKLISLLAFLFITSLYPLSNLNSSFDDTLRAAFLKTLKFKTNKLYNLDRYYLKYGWNTLTTPKDGVDVINTFSNSAISLVVVFDNISKKWAVYSPNNNSDEFLKLKYLEPNITFFVLATKEIELKIQSNIVNGNCKKELGKNSYLFIIDSGIEREATFLKDKTLSVKSRYFSNHEKGIYDDTRVMLIYPKLVDIKTKAKYHYGPAVPKLFLTFAKEYEGRKFYIYNFKERQCYKARFPSLKIPPFPILEKY